MTWTSVQLRRSLITCLARSSRGLAEPKQAGASHWPAVQPRHDHFLGTSLEDQLINARNVIFVERIQLSRVGCLCETVHLPPAVEGHACEPSPDIEGSDCAGWIGLSSYYVSRGIG